LYAYENVRIMLDCCFRLAQSHQADVRSLVMFKFSLSHNINGKSTHSADA
jgi:hypothetical protein